MVSKRQLFSINFIFVVAATTATVSSADEFDPACHYDYNARPAWSDIDKQSDRQAIGVDINANGGLIALVPSKNLSQRLDAAPNRAAWLDIFESTRRKDFDARKSIKKNQKTPLDLVLSSHQEIAFRLFDADWQFAEAPTTTGHNIPTSANGYPSHVTPFYNLKSGLEESSLRRGKVALIGYNDTDIRQQKKDCTYKYDLNVDVKTGEFVTRIIIDPEGSAGSGGFGGGD